MHPKCRLIPLIQFTSEGEGADVYDRVVITLGISKMFCRSNHYGVQTTFIEIVSDFSVVYIHYWPPLGAIPKKYMMVLAGQQTCNTVLDCIDFSKFLAVPLDVHKVSIYTSFF